MKKLALLAFLVGCGGVAPDSEVAQEKLSPGFFPIGNKHIATNFNCSPGEIPVSNFQFGTQINIHTQTFPAGPYQSATYGVEFWRDLAGETLSLYMTTLPMVEAMDGPYHILVNPWSTGLGTWPSPSTTPVPLSGSWFKYPIEIPAYGLVLYSADERPDYPSGVAVLTLDPSTNPINTTWNRFQGRCSTRKTFVFSL